MWIEAEERTKARPLATLGMTRVAVRALRPARPTKQARRQSDDCGQQLKDSSHSDANEAEGQKQQPDKRIQNQRQQRQRPAKNQEYAPEQELDHRGTSETLSCLIIRGAAENVPSAKSLVANGDDHNLDPDLQKWNR